MILKIKVVTVTQIFIIIAKIIFKMVILKLHQKNGPKIIKTIYLLTLFKIMNNFLNKCNNKWNLNNKIIIINNNNIKILIKQTVLINMIKIIITLILMNNKYQYSKTIHKWNMNNFQILNFNKCNKIYKKWSNNSNLVDI